MIVSPAPFKLVVVAPTFNNAGTLVGILDRTLAMGLDIVVVDDGCTDQSGTLLATWVSSAPPGRVRIVTHACNRGKGAALASGFNAAREAGYTHAATIDTDDQLDPESIAALATVASAKPRTLVLGIRLGRAEGCPRKNMLGRRVSNLAVRVETGWRLQDTQCGLRVYPLSLLESVRCRWGRYAFETEIIARAKWAGYGVAECPVPCQYGPWRVTHFRPLRDVTAGLALHAYLLAVGAVARRRGVPPVPGGPS